MKSHFFQKLDPDHIFEHFVFFIYLKALEKVVQGRYVVIKDERNRRVHLSKRGKCYDTQYHKQTNGNHSCNP